MMLAGTSDYTTTVKAAAEAGYGLALGIASSDGTFNTGCSVTSTVSAARRAVSVSFTATVAAMNTPADVTQSSLTTAMTTAFNTMSAGFAPSVTAVGVQQNSGDGSSSSSSSSSGGSGAVIGAVIGVVAVGAIGTIAYFACFKARVDSKLDSSSEFSTAVVGDVKKSDDATAAV